MEIDTSGGDIVQFPKDYKPPADGALFLVPAPAGCLHYFGPFEVDVTGETCTCKQCGQKVSVWHVLDNLMKHESRWMRSRQAYLEEMTRLAERRRTKCRRCGEMTEISKS